MRVECPLEVSMQEPAAPVTKQDGVTDAERYLGRLGALVPLALELPGRLPQHWTGRWARQGGL